MALTQVPASMQEPTAQFIGFKNRIINGAMAISQRGTSFSSPANQSYTLDRWKFWADGSGGTLTISQVALSPAELNPFSYAMRINQSVAATGRTYFRINQHIEGLEIFSGQQIVVSFYAKCASGTVASALRCDRYYGTGGSPSSADNITASAGLNQTITTTWARYTALATVTSTSGKTYGTNNDSSLLVGIDLPVSGTFDLYLTGFQVEFGTTLNATSFDMRPHGTELQLCQRYFEKIGGDAAADITFCTNASVGQGTISTVRMVPKRAAATIGIVGTWTASGATGPTLSGTAGTNSFSILAQSTNSGGTNVLQSSTSAYLTASAEL